MAFLLNSLMEKFGNKDEKTPGFLDMNYIVGNTTGKDVGPESPVLHRRVGRFAQLGGTTLEILIDNPATFQVEREELLSVISQLDIQTSFHGDANTGFCAAYATRGQGFQGFNPVHRYMTRYLNQLASFKKVVDTSEIYNFGISYVNMHASTEQLPALEEQIASDKSLDPFGLQVTQVNDNKKPNIYKNRKFMERFFDYFVRDKADVVRYYDLFGQYSKWFEIEWRKAREEKANDIYDEEADDLDTKASIIETAAGTDTGVDTEFMRRLSDKDLSKPIKIETPNPQQPNEEIKNLYDIFQKVLQIRPNLRSISSVIFQIRRSEAVEGRKDDILDALEEVLDSIWMEEDDDDGFSYQGKISGLVNRLDIQQNEIIDRADSDDIKEKAKQVFSGDKDAYKKEDKIRNLELWEDLVDRTPLGREIDKESAVFYNMMPAWLPFCDEECGDKHPGWDEPRFIWDKIVGDEWSGKVDFDDPDDYLQKLSENREFRLDVTAAVGATYLWGHFTQINNDFDGDRKAQYRPDLYAGLEKKEGWTWIQWLNKHQFGVNIEAMYGDPGNLLRLWRPKDIAIACRAINKTARKRAETDWEEDFYRDPVKFTIDLEHTGSYGVDPEEELDQLIEQEKELAKEEKDIDPEKPLANILKTYHLTKPGFEQTGGVGHRHGPFARGDVTLYRYLYKMIDAGFCRNPDDPGVVMFEIGGEYREEMYVIRVALDMIERGIKPDELDPDMVPLDRDYETPEEALMARFFGMDQSQFQSEFAKIEQHAFDPLKNLLDTDDFDYTFSSSAAIQNDNRPGEWANEEYK